MLLGAAAAVPATAAEQQTHSGGWTPRSGSSSGKRRARGIHIEDGLRLSSSSSSSSRRWNLGSTSRGGSVSGLQGDTA